MSVRVMSKYTTNSPQYEASIVSTLTPKNKLFSIIFYHDSKINGKIPPLKPLSCQDHVILNLTLKKSRTEEVTSCTEVVSQEVPEV